MIQENQITRAQVEAGRSRLLKRGRSATMADTYLAEVNGRRIVVKDMSPRAAWIRIIWGRYALRRELRSLRRLEGLGIAPRPVGMVDKDALAIEFIRGAPLPKKAEEGIDEAFFEKLSGNIARMHNAGVAHGDIRRTNILVEKSGEPILIDFASASVRPKYPWNLIGRALFGLRRRVDLHTLEKIRQVVLFGKEAALSHYPWYMRLGRFFRKGVYGKIKRAREHVHGKPDRAAEGLSGEGEEGERVRNSEARLP